MGEWNIMTRTRGGTVSLLKNLTEDEARGAMQRLRRPWDRGDPWSDWEVSRQMARELHPDTFFERRMYNCSDGDLEQIECWGPEGKTLDVWPKPADYDARYAAALAAARAELEPTS